MAKNSTLAMVPVTAVAVAVRVAGVFTGTVVAVAGAVRETRGILPAAVVTVIAAEVVLAPRLSVATAVRAKVLAMVGVQANV